MQARRSAGLLFLASFWAVVALMMAVQTWLSMITHGHSLARIFFFELGTWWMWGALTPLVFWLAERAPVIPFRLRNAVIHLAAAVAIAWLHVAVVIMLMVRIKPYDAMTVSEFGPHFVHSLYARLPLEIIIYASLVALAHAIAFYVRAMKLEQSLSAARLHALELQIQPHFLFNTLNAVSALVRAKQNSEAVQVIAGLSDLLRYTLDHAGEQRVSLEQEASMLRRYLEIQRVRFADRLDISIDIGAETMRAAVPTLILQPLAENAIRHGIARSAAGGRIEVHAYQRDEDLCIDMFNTGTLGGAKRGIGLRNTEERLRQLYASSYHFALRNIAGGVLAEIRIPLSVLA